MKIFNNFKKIFEKFNNKKFYITLGIIFIINCILFYMQGIQPVGDDTGTFFASDLPMHFNKIYHWQEFQYDYNSSYSLFHVILKFFKLFDGFILIAIPTAILLSAMNILTILLTRKYLKVKEYDYKTNLFAIAINLVTMIILPLKIHMPFFGIGSPNQWHNPTFTMLKPFMLLSFIEFDKIFIKKEKTNYWYFILWTVLSVLMKPSFLMMYILATLLYVFIDNIKDIKMAFKKSLVLFSCYIIPLAIFIVQSLIITGDEATTLNFMLGGNWITYAPINVFWAMLLGNLFFFTFLIVNRKKLDKTVLYISLIWICAVVEALLFGETGARSSHLNMLSPYYCAMFLTYLPIIKNTFIEKRYKNNMFLNIALALHIYSGFIYYLRFLIGLSYY